MKTAFLLSILFNHFFSPQVEEKYPFSKWTSEQKEEANTAKDVSYMTSEEKQVIFLCNLARMDGKLFSETYLQHYIDSLEIKKNTYVTTLFSTLKKTKKINSLLPSEELYKAAKEHADYTGKKGLEGHQNFNSRFKKHAPSYSNPAENCDYGSELAIDIVMSLLIDEGVPDKGHRLNILNKSSTHVGVSIAAHKQYNYTCVMDFGTK